MSSFESIEKNISFLSLLAKFGLQVSVCVGVLVVLFYCGSIGYYPSSLTVGDTFFLLAASLAFAAVHTIVVYLLFCSGVVFSPVLRGVQNLVILVWKINEEESTKTKFSFPFPLLKSKYIIEVLVGLPFWLLIVVISLYDLEKGGKVALAAILMSLVFGLWNMKPKVRKMNDNKVWQFKFFIVGLAYFIPIGMAQLGGDFLSASMSMIGVKSKGNTVMLSKEYTEFLDHEGVVSEFKNSKEGGIYKNVDILFQGIGKNTVLEIDTYILIARSVDVISGKKVEE